MIKHLPNLITCLNLATGCAGIYFILVIGEPKAIYFVLLGAFLDLFDGLVARLLKVSSEIGKQLDSLADLVTFGLLPSFYLITLLKDQTSIFWIAILIAIFSALRLAKFNVDKSQSDSFRGLPTPANAIMLTSIAFVPFELGPSALISITVLSCVLLVSNIRMIALKFSSYGWSGNELRWILIAIVLIMVIVLKWTFLPLFIPSYIAVSLISNVKKTGI